VYYKFIINNNYFITSNFITLFYFNSRV